MAATPERPAGLASLRARAAEAARFHPREVIAIGVLVVLLAIGAGLAYARGRPVAAAPLAPIGTPVAVSSSPSGGEIWVDVAGAVRHPGVYRFTDGARVFEAIRAAGGFARDAVVSGVNRARPLVDGEQIVVPRRGDPALADGGGSAGGGSAGGASGGAAQRGGKVNINLATAAEFESLPGIGPVLAQHIVDYRAQHGRFRDVKDLLKVPGIGAKKFDQLKDSVTV